jgi:hypothetical protein
LEHVNVGRFLGAVIEVLETAVAPLFAFCSGAVQELQNVKKQKASPGSVSAFIFKELMEASLGSFGRTCSLGSGHRRDQAVNP